MPLVHGPTVSSIGLPSKSNGSCGLTDFASRWRREAAREASALERPHAAMGRRKAKTPEQPRPRRVASPTTTTSKKKLQRIYRAAQLTETEKFQLALRWGGNWKNQRRGRTADGKKRAMSH